MDELKVIGRAYVRGKLLDEVTVGIEDDRISYVRVGSEGGRRIVLERGQLLLPAATDLHVHLRDWEQSYKEDVRTGTAAAIAGGVTTVAEMPNTVPPIDSAERLLDRLRLLRSKSIADFAVHVAALDDVREAAEALRLGACGMKLYPKDLHRLADYLEVSRKSGLRMVIHAEMDGDEPSAVRFILSMLKSGDDVRFAHISRSQSIEMLREAKAILGGKLKIEATPHHLLSSEDELDDDVKRISSVRPSLARMQDRIVLYEALNECIVDFIASDHAPHAIEEKLSSTPSPGFPGLDIIYPLMLTEWLDGRVGLDVLIKKLCIYPSEYLNLKKGSIEAGYYADIVVFDTKTRYRIDPTKFLSKAKYTIFKGRPLSAKVLHVFRRGEHVFDGEVCASSGSMHVKDLICDEGKE